jgi:hypothetical protein
VMRGIISIKDPFISPGYPVSLVISSQIGLTKKKEKVQNNYPGAGRKKRNIHSGISCTKNCNVYIYFRSDR